MGTSPEIVQFVQYHQPALESGTYKISVEHTISADGKIEETTYTSERTFAVVGERFGPLPIDDIYAVFPPRDSLGEHANVLPHITVKRSTLPWERYPGTEDENLPWLILLLLRDSDFELEADKPKPQNITLQTLLAATSGGKFPTDMALEVGQTPLEQVTVIDIKKKYLKDILPTKADLNYLSHVRQADNGDEFATIISSRLPEPNGSSTVHLISIERRYNNSGFDYMGADEEELIRLVSLTSWRFNCVDPEHRFTELVKKLNFNPNSLQLPNTITQNEDAKAALAMGYLPLPHAMREGSQTVSLYRSPFIPGSSPDSYDEFPVKAADQLLRYDQKLALFDVSYAAAWQLGRMLTLQNQGLATELYSWKRQNAQNLKAAEQQVLNLPLHSRSRISRVRKSGAADRFKPPPPIKSWFDDLELLKGVPFNYLVPDERLLPIESIRFFWVDSLWADCLQDGAFSVGRVTDTNAAEDQVLATAILDNNNQRTTGILMRSQVVSGWPGLLVDAYDTAVADIDSFEPDEATQLELLRMDKLAPDVLICLFAGEAKSIDVHLQAETMHFGLDREPAEEDEDGDTWSKKLRSVNGELLDDKEIEVIPWQNQAKGVINLTEFVSVMQDTLAPDFSTFTAAQFGLQMIEGVEKVRFIMPT